MDDYVVKPIRLDEWRWRLGDSRPLTSPRAAEPEVGGEATSVDLLDRGVLGELREDLGDAALLRQVIAAFLERVPSMLAELRDAAARGDTPAVLAVAHTMKGTSATLGARALSERCAEIERLARAGGMPGVVARAAPVRAGFVSGERALRAEVGDAGG